MKVFGLVGYPLTQSFSQKYFTEKFEKEKINARYLNFEIESIGEFPEIIEDTEGIVGLNVTIPYKEKIISFIQELDLVAREAGAVNLIKVLEKRNKPYLVGSNSDVYGFQQSINPMLKPHHTHALILGTGGASKAVRYVFKELGIDFKMVSRKPRTGWLTYSDLTPEIISKAPLIINTTPLGMFPNVEGFPNIPFEGMDDRHLIYDLIYNPSETVLMQKAKAAGATVMNGHNMLILQAEKSWEFWNHKTD
ncbi:MAG TPA: shikimate dehydrogenase [Marinilabiliales bacterium]|nr:MAG: shikimate dehydrogenase [Bacteroidetes bacterium GWC2_40_13]OFX71334.1 MAG: shikimate dehydrogenase [Bacteroidetes bacterium GWD2_40_43]OFX91471.1 MAG: shikimate dehydrogenase [Bacteroidetes bacterium GWE2_40_63]OFZ32195.1 MAG: shikimate dehydrogenase [Bacteroidetes bacterium RIFOXYC2_FULL_40_12]HAM97653.1 shikimate dehydrogenase [Marinilabiliales bacterium]